MSIVELAEQEHGEFDRNTTGEIVPFTAQTRMSGLDLPDGTQIRKGAGSAVIAWLEEGGRRLPSSLLAELDEYARSRRAATSSR